MTREEFNNVVKALRNYYPKETILPTREAMEFWYNALQDLEYKRLSIAISKWVTLHEWSPSIAGLREMYACTTNRELPDYGEAWGEVLRTISTYGMYKEDEALNSMSELTKAAVQRLGFRNICQSENIVSDRAQFKAIYEQLAARQKQDAQVPEIVKLTIAQMQTKQIEG